MIKTVKNSVLYALIFVIILVVGSILAFLLVPAYTPKFWVSYIFSVIAVLGLALTLFGFKDKFSNITTSISLFNIALIYLILEIIATIVCNIFIPSLSFEAYLAIQAVLFAIFAILMILMIIGRRSINSTRTKSRKEVLARNMHVLDAQRLLEVINECPEDVKTDLTPLVNELSEKIRFSDPVIKNEDKHLDDEIMNMIAELYAEINSMLDMANVDVTAVKTKIRKISFKIDSRNQIVKLNK